MIHGGLSEEGNYLNDAFILNLNPLKWINVPILNELDSPYLASHAACLVLQIELLINPKLNMLKIPELPVNRRMTTRVNNIFILDKRKRNLFIWRKNTRRRVN